MEFLGNFIIFFDIPTPSLALRPSRNGRGGVSDRPLASNSGGIGPLPYPTIRMREEKSLEWGEEKSLKELGVGPPLTPPLRKGGQE